MILGTGGVFSGFSKLTIYARNPQTGRCPWAIPIRDYSASDIGRWMTSVPKT